MRAKSGRVMPNSIFGAGNSPTATPIAMAINIAGTMPYLEIVAAILYFCFNRKNDSENNM